MEFVTTFKKEELEQIIFDQVTRCLDARLSPPQAEPPDRCGLNDARIELGTPGKPVSKAYVYQLTHLKKISFQHFGRALVFSRIQLRAYRDEHTINPPSAEEIQKEKLRRSAQKHLRNA